MDLWPLESSKSQRSCCFAGLRGSKGREQSCVVVTSRTCSAALLNAPLLQHRFNYSIPAKEQKTLCKNATMYSKWPTGWNNISINTPAQHRCILAYLFGLFHRLFRGRTSCWCIFFYSPPQCNRRQSHQHMLFLTLKENQLLRTLCGSVLLKVHTNPEKCNNTQKNTSQ